jgi:chorismate synthase
MRGSEHNDEYVVRGGRIITKTNNAGGILGGLSNGMPVEFRVAFKPTSSIARPQMSVEIVDKKPVELEIKGRHDPCIVPRAVPVVENASAAVILDLMLQGGFV